MTQEADRHFFDGRFIGKTSLFGMSAAPPGSLWRLFTDFLGIHQYFRERSHFTLFLRARIIAYIASQNTCVKILE